MTADAEIPDLPAEEYGRILDEARGNPAVGAWASGALTAGAFLFFGVGLALLAQFGSSWWATLGAGAILAVATLSLSLVVHECAHRTLFSTRWLDDPVGVAAGLFAAAPFYSYRRGHHAHHRWVGSSEGKDPTESPQEEFDENFLLDLLLKIPVLPVFYWGGVYGPYLLYDLVPTAHDRTVGRVAGWCLNVAAIVATHAALATWLGAGVYLPAAALGFVGAGILYENLFTLNQHIGLRAIPEDKPKYPYREQINFSRSVRVPLSASIFYFNLHKEHHLAPGLDWRHMPTLHRILRREHPEIYEFTEESLAVLSRRRMRAHELLTPEVGDPQRGGDGDR